MAIEHEFKWVLKISPELIAALNEKFAPTDRILISQYYLNSNTRLRVASEFWDDALLKEWMHTYFFTFKLMTEMGLIEIEKEIDSSDFLALRTKASGHVHKTRYDIHEDGCIWSIDLIYDNDEYEGIPCFAMVECEFEDPQALRPEMLDFLKEHVILNVALGDVRFTNARLADLNYAKDLYEDCLKGFSK